jgi:hypothetical protein
MMRLGFQWIFHHIMNSQKADVPVGLRVLHLPGYICTPDVALWRFA